MEQRDTDPADRRDPRSDEQAVRALHAAWIAAVNAGDLACLLGLMAGDAVFLSPGQEPVGREAFAVGFSEGSRTIAAALHQRVAGRRRRRRRRLHGLPGLAWRQAARGRGRVGAGRPPHEHLSQAAGRPLAARPRRAHAVRGLPRFGTHPTSHLAQDAHRCLVRSPRDLSALAAPPAPERLPGEGHRQQRARAQRQAAAQAAQPRQRRACQRGADEGRHEGDDDAA